MTAEPAAPHRADCPRCGGRLGPPESSDVHCFVRCTRCGERYELDDPQLLPDEAADRPVV